MDAEPVPTVDDSTPLRDELAEVLAAFEEATGLQVCFRTMSERWRDATGRSIVAAPYAGHRSSFCDTVKRRAESACTKCDLTDLPAVCSPLEGRVVEPFVRTCHAGADEILLPLWSEGVLVAVLFVGQFTGRPDYPSDPHPLRQITDVKTKHLMTMTVPLRSYLLDILRRLDSQRHGNTAGRRGTIESYIRESLSTGPTLAELAERLSLSRSRASHVIRELTGRSFQDLVEERRIAVARDLLTGSDGTVAWVARQSGFKDVAYFCRYFKRKTGATPSHFRQQHRQVVTV